MKVGHLARAALVAVALAGCRGDERGVHAEPRAPVFTPAVDRLELKLVNPGDTPVPLSRIRFDPRAPDWGAFLLEDREHPREIAARGDVSLHLRVDRKHFTRAGVERAGQARLLFVAGEAAHAVELRYAPPNSAAEVRAALVRAALLLALVGLVLAVARRTRSAPLPWTSWLPALVACALVPLGPGLCPTALGESLSAADLDQCASGRGGQPLALVAVGEGWLVYLVALGLAALGRLTGRHGPPNLNLARRDLALAGVFAGPLLAFGTFDPRVLVNAQAGGLWGLFVQPIAAAVAISVAAAPPRVGLERLGFAAAFTACFLGGATLPGISLAGTTHAVALAAGAAVLAVKLAAIAWLVQRLHTAPPGSRARAALALLGRASIPLVAANLLLTAAYGLWR